MAGVAHTVACTRRHDSTVSRQGTAALIACVDVGVQGKDGVQPSASCIPPPVPVCRTFHGHHDDHRLDHLVACRHASLECLVGVVWGGFGAGAEMIGRPQGFITGSLDWGGRSRQRMAPRPHQLQLPHNGTPPPHHPAQERTVRPHHAFLYCAAFLGASVAGRVCACKPLLHLRSSRAGCPYIRDPRAHRSCSLVYPHPHHTHTTRTGV